MNSDQKGEIVSIFHGVSVTIHFSEETLSSFTQIKDTSGAGEEIHEVAGRASGKGSDGTLRLMTAGCRVCSGVSS